MYKKERKSWMKPLDFTILVLSVWNLHMPYPILCVLEEKMSF